MTVQAHGTRHIYAGGSRTRSMDTPSVPSTLFDELHPHLRGVTVGQQSLEQRIHDYLMRRPGRTLEQIAEKMSGGVERVKRRITAHPELFRREGKLYYAISPV